MIYVSYYLCHKCKTAQIYFLYSFGGQKSEMDFTGPKSRGRQGCAPKQALGESPFPCLFQLQEAAFIPWLMASSFIFKDRSLAPLNLSDYDTLLSRLHFLLLTLILPPPSYKDPCDYTGLSSIIQDNLPISRS